MENKQYSTKQPMAHWRNQRRKKKNIYRQMTIKSQWPQTYGMQQKQLFLKLFIYLAVSGLSCGMWDLRCIMWELLLKCMDSPLWLAGSAFTVHGLSCSTACGILVLQPGDWTQSPAMQGIFLTTGIPGESQK